MSTGARSTVRAGNKLLSLKNNMANITRTQRIVRMFDAVDENSTIISSFAGLMMASIFSAVVVWGCLISCSCLSFFPLRLLLRFLVDWYESVDGCSAATAFSFELKPESSLFSFDEVVTYAFLQGAEIV